MKNSPRTISLDGNWSFFYSSEKFDPEYSSLPERGKFTGAMVTPGYWDDHYELFDEEDFFALRARFNPDYRKVHFPMGTTLCPHASSSFLIGSGFYRKTVSAPLAPGERVTLTVGPAMWGCAVYCNGVFAGRNTGYSVAGNFDLTELFKGDEENEIVLVVCNVHDDGGAYCRADGSHNGGEYGTRPGQHRGLAAQGFQSERAGIGGGVTLRIAGPSTIDDWFLSFEEELPEWHFELTNGAGNTLLWEIRDGSGTVARGDVRCDADTLRFTTPAEGLERWSDRSPKLYTFKAELVTPDGGVADSRELRWGLRRTVCSGTRILVNGIPTYFRGATEHCYFPESCNPHFDFEKYMRDLGVLKRAGFNFIRCHTWCPPEPFYDACDALGIFVQTELPSIYSFEEAEAILRMIRRHVCAAILCEGNEKKIHNVELARMRQVAAMTRRLAPGMLFNPQEALRGVEYDFMPNRTITREPMPYDREQLEKIAEFSDLYGSLGGGLFSYEHDLFPGVERVEEMHAIYKKPCLSHEIGILGGYLDFSLEKRYENTFIGTDIFEAARKNMLRHGVWQYAKLYYETNCLFISSLRKQLIENLRSCTSVTGYDYLGGIDTHWHIFGYPCGVFNEFYEEKYGETIGDVRRYNSESILLCSALNRRNFFAGEIFREKLLLSYFGCEDNVSGRLRWSMELSSGGSVASGEKDFSGVKRGTVPVLAELEISLPDADVPYECVLQVRAEFSGETVENFWEFYVFPREKGSAGPGVREADRLDDELISFVEQGGSLLLTGGFPARTSTEEFRPHTTGRVLLHAGVLLHDHPVWRDFPHRGFMEWQFLRMMKQSTAVIYDGEMPEYKVLMELIPSFKLIKRKSVLTEFKVGRGTIIMCGLVFNEDDPAAVYLRKALLDYLRGSRRFPAAEWPAAALRERVRRGVTPGRPVVKVDAGGRPVEE